MERPPRTYRCAIIGTGRIASTIEDETRAGPFWFSLPFSHAGAYAAVPPTTLVAAADGNRSRLEEFGQRYHVSALYDDYHDLLRNKAVDIVSVCTTTDAHCEVVLATIDAGVRGIFLEKPVAECLRDADKIVEACRMTNTKVVVNNHRTWDPLYQKVKQLLADGSIGVLHSIMAHWSEGILQGGVHLFDMARLLTGSEAEWVFGYLDSGSSTFDQGANGIVHFRSGADLLLDASIGNAVPWELDIVATRGRIRIGNTLYPELWKSNQASSFGELAQHPFPGACVRDSGMVGALKDLIRAMEQDATTASSEVDGRADLEIAVAFHISDRIKRPVPLPVDDLDYVIHDRWGRR